MTVVRYLPEFWPDVAGAVDWLESEQPGLGSEFARAVLSAVGVVLDHPHGFTAVSGGVRRFVIRKFHFLVFYEVVDDDVLFLGVVHESRDLSAWLQRRRPFA